MNKTYFRSMLNAYRTLFRSLGAMLLLAFGHLTANATHIVGGSLSYRCIAKDVYEVTVVVRRDCFNGDPEAYFDNPASVGIFDRTGELLGSLGTKGQLLLKLMIDDTLSEIRENLCFLEGERSVCVHETTYRGTISLPYRAGGYYLMYQRCCRNLPLQNIIDPLQTGASWLTYISEEAMTECNSSPVFKQWAPIFLCANKPFTFKHDATDQNGDSLVYKLWTPFTGATKAFPKPQPPNKPDFNPVAWQTPYSENNMLGGEPFKIDARTGEITANPNTLGLYLLGLKVEEYRRGKLIGTVYRDFEITVLDCSNLIDAKIDAPSLQCGNLTVNFKSESTNAGLIRWFFDYDRNKNATSTLANPTYQYTDTGFYRVALIITKDSSCFDTAFHTIHLKSGSAIQPKFTTQPGTCVNGNLTLFLIDQSTGLDPTAQYLWTITYNNQTVTSTLKNPVLTVPNGVAATIKLEITENGPGCSAASTQSIITSFLRPGDHRDQQDVCTGDTVKINFILADSIKGKYNYTWDPSPLIISGANTPEPVIKSNVNQNVYLYVTVDNKNGCSSRDSILIRSLTKPKLDFRFVNACGSLAVKVVNLSDQLTNYLFNFGDGTTSTEREPSHTYARTGNYTVTLSSTDGCGPTLSKNISLGLTPCISLRDTISACVGTSLRINPKANPIYSYIWRPTTKLSDLTIPNPIFVVDSARTFIADIFDANTGIGIGTHTIVVVLALSEQIKNIKDTVIACAGQGVALNPGGNPNLKYVWSPAQFLDNPTAVNPIATVDSTTRFTVVITNPSDTCSQSKQLVVIIPSKLAAAVIPDSLSACVGIPINLNPNGKADPNLKYQWSPANLLDDATKVSPLATITTPTTFTVTITDIRFPNCQVTKSVRVNIPLIEELKKIRDSITVCAGIATALNPTGDSRFTYSWSPVTGLDNPNLANPTATVQTTTIYTVTITDSQRGGCQLSKQMKVIVPPSFTVVPAFRDSVSCSSSSFRLRVSSNNPRVTFEWFNPAGGSIGRGDTLTVTPSQRTTYRVIGTDEFGCQRSDTVRVDPAAVRIGITVPGGGLVCQGDSIRLQVNNLNPNQVLTYVWTPTTEIVSGANTATPVIRPTANRTYYVQATNAQGCTTRDSAVIKFSAVQPITVTATPTTIVAGQTSQITATNIPGYTYSWTPPTGLNNPNIPNPIASPTQTTTYRLTATNPDGCPQVREVTITVNVPECERPNIFLPNAFTPNGDGKNDVLYLRGVIVDRMSLRIYDRWGEKVFESTNQSVGWDGTYKGKLLPPDVYGYYLVVDCIGGDRFTEQGNVTILR